MENITIIQIEEHGEVLDYVLIDRGNEQFTSMLKSTYDELKANEATAE
jgi:hypothetical protein